MSSDRRTSPTVMNIHRPTMTKAFTDTLNTTAGAYRYIKEFDEQKKMPERLALRYIIERYFKGAPWQILIEEETAEREHSSALLSLVRDESYAVDELLTHTDRRVSNGSWQNACTKAERVHILRCLLRIFCHHYGYNTPNVTLMKRPDTIQPH